MTTTMTEAALEYARRGWRVLPLHGIVDGHCTCGRHECTSPGKHPRYREWPAIATTDADVIARWFRQPANIGIATGRASGIIVLDIDAAAGGLESLARLKQQHGQLPETPCVRTGGGGLHYYFRAPDQALGNRAGILPGIDLRADGGLVVAPPSMHASGAQYDWLIDGDIAPVPAWLLRLLGHSHSSGNGAGRQARPTEADAPIPEGRRNSELARLAGAMRRRGATQASIDAALLAENARRCMPPLPEHEVRAIAASISRYAPAQPAAEAGASRTQMQHDQTDHEQEQDSGLILTQQGAPRACLANAIWLIRHHADWHGVLAWDDFAQRTIVQQRPSWLRLDARPGAEWLPAYDVLATEWMHRQGVMVGCDVVGQAIETVAHEHPVHPVRAWLEDLRWDGVRRVHRWLTDYLGADHTDYSSAVGERWLVSAIARIYSPGCKADCVLILEGPQGAGKSSTLRILGGHWYGEHLDDVGSKDGILQTHGAWIIELSELDALSRAESARIKSYLSRATDRYRPPYGRRVVEAPRQCIFGGTINHSGYLRDETGGRRFWPVACSEIDLEALARDRDQLWAEARELYEAGRPWWLDSRELEQAAREEQQDRYECDPWESIIEDHLRAHDDISTSEILEYALHIVPQRWTPQDYHRVIRCLRHLGWVSYRPRDGASRSRRYRRP